MPHRFVAELPTSPQIFIERCKDKQYITDLCCEKRILTKL